MNLIILQSVTRVYFSTGFLGGLSNDPRPDIDLFFSSFLFGFGEKRLNGGPPSRHIKWRRKHRYDGCLMRSIDFSINFKWSRLVLNTKRCLISKLEPFKSPAGRELRALSVSSTIISSFNSIFCAHRSICLQISLRCFLWIKSDSGEALGRKKKFLNEKLNKRWRALSRSGVLSAERISWKNADFIELFPYFWNFVEKRGISFIIFFF